MNPINLTLGWMLVALALLFTIGLSERLAARFYPGAPSLGVRLAAPLVFATLSAACFAGAVMPTLLLVVALGGGLGVVRRLPERRPRQANR